MIRLRTMVLVALATLMGVAGVEAQGPGGRGGPGGGMMMADLGRVLEVALQNGSALGFSGEQVEQLTSLKVEVDRALEPHREDLAALRGGGGRGGAAGGAGGNRDAMRALMQKVQEITASHRVQFEEITTPSQREALLPLLRRRPGDQ